MSPSFFLYSSSPFFLIPAYRSTFDVPFPGTFHSLRSFDRGLRSIGFVRLEETSGILWTAGSIDPDLRESFSEIAPTARKVRCSPRYSQRSPSTYSGTGESASNRTRIVYAQVETRGSVQFSAARTRNTRRGKRKSTPQGGTLTLDNPPLSGSLPRRHRFFHGIASELGTN